MAAQTTSYDGTHFQVALMNMRDGSVQGHAAGCADLTRNTSKFAEKFQADEIVDVRSKRDALEFYNADFDEETDGWYEINWLPCAKHVPATEADRAGHPDLDDADPVAAEIVASRTEHVWTKPGRIWTYVYRGDTLIAEVRTDSVAAVLAALS